MAPAEFRFFFEVRNGNRALRKILHPEFYSEIRKALCNGTCGNFSLALAHQDRTIAISSDFRVDGAKSPASLRKEGALGSEITARNRNKSLATFHRALKSQCSTAFSCLGDR